MNGSWLMLLGSLLVILPIWVSLWEIGYFGGGRFQERMQEMIRQADPSTYQFVIAVRALIGVVGLAIMVWGLLRILSFSG